MFRLFAVLVAFLFAPMVGATRVQAGDLGSALIRAHQSPLGRLVGAAVLGCGGGAAAAAILGAVNPGKGCAVGAAIGGIVQGGNEFFDAITGVDSKSYAPSPPSPPNWSPAPGTACYSRTGETWCPGAHVEVVVQVRHRGHRSGGGWGGGGYGGPGFSTPVFPGPPGGPAVPSYNSGPGPTVGVCQQYPLLCKAHPQGQRGAFEGFLDGRNAAIYNRFWLQDQERILDGAFGDAAREAEYWRELLRWYTPPKGW